MIVLKEGRFGWVYLVVNLATGEDILIQSDWDYPGTASTFGWSPCHGETDGTIDCPVCGKVAQELIQEAGDYLGRHIGEEAEDPGFFS